MSIMYSKDGNWLFENPQANKVHDITIEDIDQLLFYADQDDVWADAVKKEVIERDKALRDGTSKNRINWLFEEFRIIQVSGTIIQMPYGDRIITFPSKRQLFRGENKNYRHSIPSLNRILKDVDDEREKELLRIIAFLRKWKFTDLIWNINVVPYWSAKLSDVNYDALAQHYGLPTHLLDLTNDFYAALFFATCKYDSKTDSFFPLTQTDIDKCEDTKYGYIFHAPDWTIDYFNGGGFSNWRLKHLHNENMMLNRNKRFYLQSGDMDGVALQIGYQPLQRCHHQSGYIYPMRNEPCLQDDWHFEKLRFRHSAELSEKVYNMMDQGKRVFPYEGVSDLRSFIEEIKHSTVFSKDELNAVYENDGIDRTIFATIEDLKKDLIGYDTADGFIEIQEEPIAFDIPQELLDRVNIHYDEKDLLETVGGMIHRKYSDEEYLRQRCIDIYGKMI